MEWGELFYKIRSLMEFLDRKDNRLVSSLIDLKLSSTRQETTLE